MPLPKVQNFKREDDIGRVAVKQIIEFPGIGRALTSYNTPGTLWILYDDGTGSVVIDGKPATKNGRNPMERVFQIVDRALADISTL